MVKKGDVNTNFFHIIASSRKRNNLITSLTFDGAECMDPSLIDNHIFTFYKSLLGSKGLVQASFSPDVWSEEENVTFTENQLLFASFMKTKIHSTIFQMDANKAPGLDRFPIFFINNFGI